MNQLRSNQIQFKYWINNQFKWHSNKATKFCFIALLLTSLNSMAGGILRIEPENPTEGQNVQLYYYDCEPPFPHIDSNELYYTEQTNNLIQFVGFFTFSQPLCPFLWEQYYDLGTFTEGEYVLEIYLFLADMPLPIDLDPRTPNETLIFNVSGPPIPQQIPTLGSISFLLLVLLFLAIPLLMKRKS